MNLALDHLFICVAEGAPEAEALREFGLSEGSGNVHSGQGTRNRRFFFHNATLELLWVDDPQAAQRAPASRTGLWERWSGRGRGVSPFGVALRPAVAGQPAWSFPSRPYRPPYLPGEAAIEIAEAPLTEPMWFYLPFGQRPDAAPQTPPPAHAMGLREITEVRLIGLPERPSAAAEALATAGLVTLESGAQPFMELVFDHGARGMQADFWPELPLSLRW